MICNEVYRGVIVWNRVGKIRNPQTGRKVPRVNPRSEWQWIEAPHLRIVPEELWQETAARLAKARNANCGWGRACRLVAFCRASCAVARAAQAWSRPARSAAGRWRGAPAR